MSFSPQPALSWALALLLALQLRSLEAGGECRPAGPPPGTPRSALLSAVPSSPQSHGP